MASAPKVARALPQDPWFAETIHLSEPLEEEPLRRGAFVSDCGFRVEPVPPGVRFRRATGDGHRWEVVNGLEERVAIVAARPLAKGETPPKLVGHTVELEGWDEASTRIQVERFSRNGWVYYIQRRLDGARFLHESWYNERSLSVLSAQ